MGRAITDRSIIITGASSGIGAATAVACADAGMDVVLNARRVERLEAVADQVRQAGRTAVTVPGGVTDEGLSERLLDAADGLPGGLYAAFANAGYGLDRPIVDMTDEDLHDIFNVNFFAATDLIQRAARRLLERSAPGHLIMCSSCLARFTMPNNGVYAATKAAQNHVSRAMRMELRGTGIEVAAVMPVTTETEFFDASARNSGGAGNGPPVPRPFVQPPQRVARAIVRCLHRPRPEVWTSTPTRLGAALMTACPRLMDAVMTRAARIRDRSS